MSDCQACFPSSALDFEHNTLEEYPSYCTPITAQEGTIIVNTELMKENKLDNPTSLKDLAKPEYKGQIAVTDIASSSTAWLLIQGLVSEYGEDGQSCTNGMTNITAKIDTTHTQNKTLNILHTVSLT